MNERPPGGELPPEPESPEPESLMPGTQLAQWTHLIERGKVLEFARAVQQTHADDGLMLPPPTFPMVISADIVAHLVRDVLKLDMARTVHGAQEYVYSRPMRIGELVSCRIVLQGDISKPGRRGGQMRFITLETTITAAHGGEPICRDRMTIIEKSGDIA